MRRPLVDLNQLARASPRARLIQIKVVGTGPGQAGQANDSEGHTTRMLVPAFQPAEPAGAAVQAAPDFLVLESDSTVGRFASAEAAIRQATHRLRDLIEHDAVGTIKVLDPIGRVLWRESAVC